MNQSEKTTLVEGESYTSTIYLLRHGSIEQTDILCGHTDIALSKKGWEQLSLAYAALPQLSQCYSSPLQRCLAFAKKQTQIHNVPLKIDIRLKEMNFGKWDGETYTSLLQHTEINNFWESPWVTPPPLGESMPVFCERVDDVWKEICENNLANSTSLIVSHGGVIKHILARVLNMPIPGNIHLNTLDIKYAGLIKITLFHEIKANEIQIWPQIVFT